MVEIKLPSKTFLLGEYLALLGLPCLLINTPPDFVLTASESKNPVHRGIPDGSPTSRFIKENVSVFKNIELIFYDPHHGLGGLGASSAQFLAVYLFKHSALYQQWLKKSLCGENEITDLLNCYQQFAWNKQGLAPSGADIISQLTGDITYFDKNNLQVERLTWPFKNYSFLLVRTQKKIATHQHLLEIDKSKIVNLPNLAAQAKSCLLEKNPDSFANCITQFSTALQEQGLVINHTQNLLGEINQLPGVLASKGCGALGADVIFVFCENESALREWCGVQQLSII